MKEVDEARDAALRRKSVALAGEGLEYFARYQLRVLRRVLGRSFSSPVLDYGCGLGDFTRLLAQTYDVVHGYDPSSATIELARRRVTRAELFDDPESLPRGYYGAVVMVGALRHVPPENRPGMMRSVAQLLAPRGRAIVFEHNALNLVMRRVARDAEGTDVHLLGRRELRRLLREAKLERVRTEYIVFFPRALSLFRPLEPLMGAVPLGAQIVAHGEK